MAGLDGMCVAVLVDDGAGGVGLGVGGWLTRSYIIAVNGQRDEMLLI